MYICIDFDGTVVDHCFPEIGAPAPGAIFWLRRFTELGGMLILFTMRSNGGERDVLKQAVDYLESQGVQLFGINRNPAQASWTQSPKAYGHVYIDDAAFGCPVIRPEGFQRACVDWSIVGPAIELMLVARRT